MIRNIRIQGLKSFPKDAYVDIPINHTLRIALFYGNNGAGKTTIGQVIHHNGNQIDPYLNCSVIHTGNEHYLHLVYNEEFLEQNFRNKSDFPGIFSIGKADVDALREIDENQIMQEAFIKRRAEIDREMIQRAEQIKKDLLAAEEATWKVYKQHSDGLLGTFLNGMGKSKSKVFERLNITKIATEDVLESLDSLLARMTDIESVESVKNHVNLDVGGIVEAEQSMLWEESIVGSSDSRLSPVIKALGNMDWVNAGANHIKDDQCPFCQEKFPDDFMFELNKLIDTTYRDKVGQVNILVSNYKLRLSEIESHMKEMFANESFANENEQLHERWNKFQIRMIKNLELMQSKKLALEEVISIQDSRPEMGDFFQVISDTNTRIDIFNERIKRKYDERKNIEADFWKLMRNEHNGTVELYQSTVDDYEQEISRLDSERLIVQNNLDEINSRLSILRENSVGTDRAVEAINLRLNRHGISDFKIVKKAGDGNLYCLERAGIGSEDYKSLSEGEKTVIAFFYFIELVNGSLDKEQHVAQNKKIVVIDDPISSLSNTFVYDIAWLIVNEIIAGDNQACQVFVLTHSLFFHHELIKQIHQKKLQKQCQYFRVVKRPFTTVLPMQKDDIKNDYDAAWEVIKDAHAGNGTTVGVANAMRCIFEQFFTFTSQQSSFKEALNQLETEDRRFVPLSRYLDNQSHRNDQNLTDFGDHDLNFYLDKFKAVFDATSYPHHYSIRMGIDVEEIE